MSTLDDGSGAGICTSCGELIGLHWRGRPCLFAGSRPAEKDNREDELATLRAQLAAVTAYKNEMVRIWDVLHPGSKMTYPAKTISAEVISAIRELAGKGEPLNASASVRLTVESMQKHYEKRIADGEDEFAKLKKEAQETIAGLLEGAKKNHAEVVQKWKDTQSELTAMRDERDGLAAKMERLQRAVAGMCTSLRAGKPVRAMDLAVMLEEDPTTILAARDAEAKRQGAVEEINRVGSDWSGTKRTVWVELSDGGTNAGEPMEDYVAARLVALKEGSDALD
jgi:chromosome segregation ATPase